MLLETVMNDFVSDGKYRKLSPRTLDLYAYRLKEFRLYCLSLGIDTISDVSGGTLKSFALQLQENGINSGGVALRFRVIRALFKYAEREEIEHQSPFKRFKTPRVELRTMEFVSFEDFEALVSAARESSKPLRDVSIISLLFDTGIRVGELLNLKECDVVSERGMIKVSGKTGERFVPVSKAVLKRLRLYLTTERPQSRLSLVFLADTNTPLTYSSVKLMLERTSQRAGMKYKSPHCFRRGFATRMVQNGADVFSIQRILGHTTLAMTNRYAVLNYESLKQVHLVAAPTRK